MEKRSSEVVDNIVDKTLKLYYNTQSFNKYFK